MSAEAGRLAGDSLAFAAAAPRAASMYRLSYGLVLNTASFIVYIVVPGLD